MRGKKFDRLQSVLHNHTPRFRHPLVEILGQRRVLIENHICVLDYQPNQIDVKVSYGKLSISGSGLVISYMSCERLVITGTVDSVTLCRGCGK